VIFRGAEPCQATPGHQQVQKNTRECLRRFPCGSNLTSPHWSVVFPARQLPKARSCRDNPKTAIVDQLAIFVSIKNSIVSNKPQIVKLVSLESLRQELKRRYSEAMLSRAPLINGGSDSRSGNGDDAQDETPTSAIPALPLRSQDDSARTSPLGRDPAPRWLQQAVA